MSNDYDDDEDEHDGDKHHQTIEERVREAISNGDSVGIEDWHECSEKSDWNELYDKGETLGKALEGPYFFDGQSIQDACLALINGAVKDGRTDIFDCYATDFDGQQVLQPLHDLVNHGFDRVLLRFLGAGLKPEQPLKGDGLLDATAIDMADRLGQPATAAMFRAHVARRIVNETLADLSHGSTTKVSP